MSHRSAKARPADRVACTFIVVLLALLLAAVSVSMSGPEEVEALPPSAASPVQTAQGSIAPSDGAAAGAAVQTRRYHPELQPSNESGMLGFSMLISLCVLLLGAALAPMALQRLRRHG